MSHVGIFDRLCEASPTFRVWSMPTKRTMMQRGGAPGQGLHPGAGVAHTVPPLHTLPAPQAQAGQKFEFWRISSLSRIADFSIHFQSLVSWLFPKICLGWSTFGIVKDKDTIIPDYNFVHKGHIKTKRFLLEQLFWKVPLTSSRTPFWQTLFCPSIVFFSIRRIFRYPIVVSFIFYRTINHYKKKTIIPSQNCLENSNFRV